MFYISISLQILGILCMALASPARLSGTHWFLFVVTISFIFTIIWIFVYLLSIREALKLPIDWVLSVSYSIKIVMEKVSILQNIHSIYLWTRRYHLLANKQITRQKMQRKLHKTLNIIHKIYDDLYYKLKLIHVRYEQIYLTCILPS